VLKMPLATLQPSLPTLTGIRAQYLMGVTEERVVVLDFDRILSDPAIVVRQESD
jgi:purine-binding chemotaxis protein CheW